MIGIKNDQDSFNDNFLIQSFVYSLIVSKIIMSKFLNCYSIVSVFQSIYSQNMCIFRKKILFRNISTKFLWKEFLLDYCRTVKNLHILSHNKQKALKKETY